MSMAMFFFKLLVDLFLSYPLFIIMHTHTKLIKHLPKNVFLKKDSSTMSIDIDKVNHSPFSKATEVRH